MNLSIIVAFDQNRLIGKNNQLPWHLSADLKHFKSLTMGHCMIMGRKTFESIGKPLPGRVSVVITRNQDLLIPGCSVVHGMDEALKQCERKDEIFVIGGAEVFASAMTAASRLYVTQIHHAFEGGDSWFPEIDLGTWKEISRTEHEADEKNPWPFSFITYVRA